MRILAMVLMVSLAACATTPDGDEKVDRTECLETVAQARAALLACQFIEDADKRQQCELGAEIGIAAARFGCSFAEEYPDGAYNDGLYRPEDEVERVGPVILRDVQF